MKNKKAYFIAVSVLALIGISLAAYKTIVLGVPLFPRKEGIVWLVEAKITFNAQNAPVKASLILPQKKRGYKIFHEDVLLTNYSFEKIPVGNNLRAVWTSDKKSGKQTIYYRVEYYDLKESVNMLSDSPPALPEKPFLNKPSLLAAQAVIKDLKSQTDKPEEFVLKLYDQVYSSAQSENISLLLNENSYATTKINLMVDLLTLAEIPAQVLRGLFLEETSRNQNLYELIEFHNGSKWISLDLQKGSLGMPANFAVWQRGGKSILDLEGGRKSKVVFSVTKSMVSALSLAKDRASKKNLLQFSINNLPVSEQNAFKALLLLPIAALIVVIIRVVIGLPTSGTFMPILITLAFKQTQLMTGIILFLIIVSLGLFIRSYLSRLNLLLVPRITAVIIIVVILMMFISTWSYYFGITKGLSITFFPLIILSWTIERMSICWEEQGYKEAIKKTSGSLIIAIITYIVINNPFIKHIAFFFPEMQLVILSAVLLLGNYTGYRVSELIRFQPMIKD